MKESQTYHVVPGPPGGKLNKLNIPVFPALALPLEKKRDFQCPKKHLIVLDQCIPEVSIAKGGFTDFVVGDEADNFLRP